MRVVALRQWGEEKPNIGAPGDRWRHGSHDLACDPDSLGCGERPQAGTGGGMLWLSPRRAARVRRRTGSSRSNCR